MSAFKREVEDVLFELRSSITAVISSLAKGAESATALTEFLKIDKTLAWKLFNFFETEDVFLSTQYIPGYKSFNTFLKQSAKKKASSEHITRARDAMVYFYELIERYAGDRSSFDLLVLGLSVEGSKKAYSEQKKACFQAQRFLTGASASVEFITNIILPDGGDSTEIVGLKGFVNMIKYRKGPITLYRAPLAGNPDDTLTDEMIKRKPLDIRNEQSSIIIPYLHDYCTCDTVNPGKDRIFLTMEDICSDSAAGSDRTLNMVTSERVTFNGAKYDSTSTIRLSASVTMPVELLLMDVFISKDEHRGLPDISVYSDLLFCNAETKLHWMRMDIERMPFDEKVMHIGRGAYCSQLPGVPWYSNMIIDVFHRIGLDENEFDVFRVRIEHPYLPSEVTLTWSGTS
ncbi:MAG: hypothetical protein KAR44_09680 [Candidatus Aegiribacteria sp.]|nr:hypothetical protein [Candidatus Aegiribacteria sp.]